MKQFNFDYKKIIDFIKKHIKQNNKDVINTVSAKGIIIPFIVTVILAAVIEYFMLFPLTIFYKGTVIFVICLIGIFTFMHYNYDGSTKLTKACCTVMGLLVVYIFAGSIYSSAIFHAKEYQSRLDLDKSADFYKDNETISYKSIPVVDRSSAKKLGNKKIGQMIDYVSQFEVDETYEQINYDETPVRVTPLVYSDTIKWLSNYKEGIPAYVKVNMVSQKTEVVELKEGMKYGECEHFSRNIYRHLQLNYPTKMFEELAFEIDDQGTPYWIAPVYEYKIGIFGGEDIVGAVLVNAINGDHQYYDVKDVPEWVDRVYPQDLIYSQLENWGQYTNGFFNTLFSQKGVLQATDGYNYLAINDDVYFYTGLTSVSGDASNVGFALINLRTKEAKYYNISGADESSAMESAEGKVQNLGYSATFPILVNAGGQPTYFCSLKDDAQLVKKYAFVNVSNYQIVATGDTVKEAEANYYEELEKNEIEVKNKEKEVEKQTKTGKISSIASTVEDGNSYYYFTLDDEKTVYKAKITISYRLPLLKTGDKITITYDLSSDDYISIDSIN